MAVRPASTPPAWHENETIASGRMRIIEGEITDKSQIPEIACPIVKEELILPEGYQLSSPKCQYMIVAKRPTGSIVTATCSPEYQCIGNDMMLDKAFEAFAKHGIQAKLSFALTMNNMSQVSYCFQIADAKEFFIGGHDKHDLFINIMGSNDKTLGKKVFGSATRVVCNNTMQFALKGTKELIAATFYHSQKGYDDFQNLPNIIEATLAHRDQYSKLAEQMGNRVITMHEAKAIAAQMLSNGSDKLISTQVFNAADSIATLFQKGKGNKGENLGDFLNGVTEYFTSGDGSGKKADAFQKAISADYGNAADKKKSILLDLQNDDGDLISDAMIDSLIARGNVLLKNKELDMVAV